MHITEADLRLLDLLARRLERLSADSKWAHRASGLRGQLLRVLDQAEEGAGMEMEKDELERLVESAFQVLRGAAREIW